MDFRNPFRGSRAVADGLLTAKVLRGPRFERLFPDIYLAAGVPIDLATRARAAYLLVEGRGAVGGHAAAELLDASCGPEDAPVDLVCPHRVRARSGLVVRERRLDPDVLCGVDGVVVTSPLQTAYDLARWCPLVEAVVAVDALAHRYEFLPSAVVRYSYDRLGARGSARLPDVARLADPLAASPMETRIRLAIRFADLPLPVLQHPVGPYALDLGYPKVLLGIEHDGREHLTPERAMRDLDRQAYLTAAGWTIVRFPKADVLYRPWAVAQRVRWELTQRGAL